MKKLLLLFLLFSFVCTIPSYARKVIVSPNDDRTVKSRSMGDKYSVSIPDVPEALLEKQNSNKNNIRNYQVNSVSGYQIEKYEKYYKPVLEKDFRPELMGTTWDYHDYNANTNANNVKYQDNYSEYENKEVNRVKYSREASDYNYKNINQ